MLVAGLSAVLSTAGATVATTSLQLLVYTILGTGPLGAIRPWWWPPVLLLGGVAWSLLLLLPGWLASPLAAEQRSTAAVYRAIARALRAAGTPDFAVAHQNVVTALNAAWDDLASRRARTSGRDPELVRIAALLNLTHPLTEAMVTAVQEGVQVAPEILDAMDGIADSLQFGTPVPPSPPVTGRSPGERALAAAVAAAADVLAGRRRPGPVPRLPRRRLRDRLHDIVDETIGGRVTRIFALRLMASIGVAEVIRQTVPVERSYWVALTVAIVLRPDLGSVFVRALQRGIGTVVGAVLGAVILISIPPGPLLLVPCAVFAALLPYGRERNWGLFSTFLTPLVVLLIDLLRPLGWGLALDRLIDTLIGCAIVLLVGYAPWPSSWHAHLPQQLATALDMVARYTDQALLGAPGRSALRRSTYRALSDLRAEFQRTMAEPPSMSRRAAPAVAGPDRAGACHGHGDRHVGGGGAGGLAARGGGPRPAGDRAARDGGQHPGRPPASGQATAVPRRTASGGRRHPGCPAAAGRRPRGLGAGVSADWRTSCPGRAGRSAHGDHGRGGRGLVPVPGPRVLQRDHRNLGAARHLGRHP